MSAASGKKRKTRRGFRGGSAAAALAAVMLAALCFGACGRSGGIMSTAPAAGGESSFSAAGPAFSEGNGAGTAEVDTIFRAPGAGNTTYIYDSAYLDEVFGAEEPSLADLHAAIEHNAAISDRFKALISEYCTRYVESAPQADRRILYHNLKTLRVKETSDYGLALDTFSTDAAACYVFADNSITVLTTYSFDKGTWEYQILFHELSHAARNAEVRTAEQNYVIRSGGSAFHELMCDETLNTIFAVGLFDYEEKDLAYQLQSNFMDILVSSMDNYEMADYINHSQSYFIARLDEYAGGQDASDMIRLLQAQYDDFHDDSYKREQSEYYPLYDYVADVFYRGRIEKDTPLSEAQRVHDELVQRVSFDVPEEYELDLGHFDAHFRTYCEERGIG